jgi:hypothetical protein
MATKKAAATTAKKVPAKKAAPTPAKKAATAAKKTETSKASEGKYPWLANRFKAAIVSKLPEDVRSQARAELKGIPDFIGAVNHAGEKFGFITDPVEILQFGE